MPLDPLESPKVRAVPLAAVNHSHELIRVLSDGIIITGDKNAFEKKFGKPTWAVSCSLALFRSVRNSCRDSAFQTLEFVEPARWTYVDV